MSHYRTVLETANVPLPGSVGRVQVGPTEDTHRIVRLVREDERLVVPEVELLILHDLLLTGTQTSVTTLGLSHCCGTYLCLGITSARTSIDAIDRADGFYQRLPQRVRCKTKYSQGVPMVLIVPVPTRQNDGVSTVCAPANSSTNRSRSTCILVQQAD